MREELRLQRDAVLVSGERKRLEDEPRDEGVEEPEGRHDSDRHRRMIER